METITTWGYWRGWAEEGSWTMLPYVLKSKTAAHLPDNWKETWEKAGPYSFVLESGKSGRYTFLGLNPVSVIRGKGNAADIHDLRTGTLSKVHGKPLKLLQEWLAPFRSPSLPGLPKFSGGAVGFLAYDVVRSLERLPRLAKDDLGLDDYVWMRMEELYVVDHQEGDVYFIVHCPVNIQGNEAQWEEKAWQKCDATQGHLEKASADSLRTKYMEAERLAHQMSRRWEQTVRYGEGRPVNSTEPWIPKKLPTASIIEPDFGGSSSSISQENFEEAVRRVQRYITAGDVFQVNLSLRQGMPMQTSPERVYEQLRALNPSPYMGMLRFPDFQLVSASPELLVKVEKGQISTRPIAGTRRRGHTPDEDAAMEEELRSSEKEQAEHIMLVDLLRNDLGRVARYGTVQASELFTIERYSHVMHLVSEVRADLHPDKSLFDVIAAVFPGGTITGAPKVRTMEIIEELEPVTRGPYTGSIGWIDYNGNMELNIIIRTLVVKDGTGYIQAGAGIVIDSIPYREYKECHNKAKAIALAVRRSVNPQEQR
ncbi:anthranilate synthase component I family protein [Paenibacillus puldeungensis]|uniref:Anthranilate synthase component I family protein n=1 Tax=Paenibacillus puldeungensis TaxID=696536 RepID=A0ABW3S5S5_9BACL